MYYSIAILQNDKLQNCKLFKKRFAIKRFILLLNWKKIYYITSAQVHHRLVVPTDSTVSTTFAKIKHTVKSTNMVQHLHGQMCWHS